MKNLSFPVLGRSLAPLLVAFCGTACSTADDGAGSSSDELKLENTDIPTSLTLLRPGDPFVPGLDETLLQVGAASCVPVGGISIAADPVTSSAAIVSNRQSLSRELGLDVSGTIPVAGGITGAASLSTKTTFDRQSAVVLFQATGTYKSVLTSVADAVPKFSPADVSRCGYGYITEANHRVTAALVVSVRSTGSGSEVRGSAGAGKSGVAEAKVTLSNIISKGQVEISVRYATDVIPNLSNAPIGDSVFVVGNSDEDKQAALDKINRALDWLGQTHSDISKYLDDLRTGYAVVSEAPTQSVRFRFYPETSRSVRTAVEKASTNAIAARASLDEATALIDGWDRFAKEAQDGGGFNWNMPNAPAGTLDELQAKKRELIDNGGKLTTHRDSVDNMLDECVRSLRNDDQLTSDLATSLEKGCKAPPALPVDKRTNEIRPIVANSIDETNNNSMKCPGGYRRPLEEEAKLFGPWSRSLRPNEKGIWMEKSGCKFSKGWIYDGNPGCTPFSSTRTGLTICVSSEKGPTPND